MVNSAKFLFFLLLLGCLSQQNLTKTPIINSSIKLNGYYIGNQNGVYNILLIYDNGLIRYVGSLDSDNANKVSNYLIKEYINSKPKNDSRVGWGVIRINNLDLEYDMYYPRMDAPIYTRKGIILNDSTFQIESVSAYKSKKINTENIVYHFRSFSPKPDSTNNFIK